MKCGDKVRVIRVSSQNDKLIKLGQIGEITMITNKHNKAVSLSVMFGIHNVTLSSDDIKLVEKSEEFNIGDKVQVIASGLVGDIHNIVYSDAINKREIYHVSFGEIVGIYPCWSSQIKLYEPTEEFKKFDSKKSRVDLIDSDFLLGMGDILSFGADKYGEGNYKKCKDYNRYFAATLRHLLQWKKGDILDEESGKNHLLHAASSLMFLYELSTKE